MIAERGTRDKLEKYLDLSRPLTVTLTISGNSTYDFTCFGVDSDEKLSDDRYMIFYNQLSSPNGEIFGSEINSGMNFTVKLNDLPKTIQKLVFTASIDGAGTMGEISAHKISIGDEITANFSGSDFKQEKAITSLEIYRKNGWRFNVVARGFNGGLDALLKFYGGENADENADETPAPEKIQPPAQNPPQPPTSAPTKGRTPFKFNPPPSTAPTTSTAPTPKKISLEKKISEGAPKLISLVKPLKVELEKRNLQDVTARVALVIDMSGSMTHLYRDGTVQEIVNKILPVAVQFDDDGELDFWFFGDVAKRQPNVTLKNYEQTVPADWEKLMFDLGGGNDEPDVMEDVIMEYESSKLPAYVVFISDGGIYKNDGIKKLLIESSYLPIFWQFVGIGRARYGILEQFDNMKGRYIDNANFFALDDFRTVSNEELYSRLLNEFPAWLKLAESKGVLDGSAKTSRSNPPPRNSPSEKSFGDKIRGFFGF